MSVKGIHWAQEMRGVCPFKKALLYALGERHNKDTQLCCPDQVMLAQDAGMAVRTVRKYLRMLEKDGLIKSRTVGRPGGSRVTHYTLAFDRRTPQAEAAMRHTVPDHKPAKRAALNRQNVPDRSEGQCGTLVPDKCGTLVPFPKDTKLHEETHSPSGCELAFEEIWQAFRKVHAANGNQSRMKGKAKTLKLFERKAAKFDAATIKQVAHAEVRRQRAKDGGKYLAGLIPWLNDEPWDTGEPAKPDAELTQSEKLYAFETMGRWDASWGPQPKEDLFA